MSLHVPTALLERAGAGQISDDEFVDCVRQSLPYAWSVISAAVEDAHGAPVAYGEHAVPPPGEVERGQLLRALASDAIRGALERHFGVRLAFQNCHRVAAFRPADVGGPSYVDFVSPLAQIRNQAPELRNC